MRTIYQCEVCEREFDTLEECENHEKECGSKKSFTCDKCGKTIEWINDDMAFISEEQCHRIYLGRPGYGSKLDGSDVNFNLCDDCLYELVLSLKNSEKVFNSGSNFYIDYTDEELFNDEYED